MKQNASVTARRAAALGVAALFTLAACGSDDDGGDATGAESVSISDPWSREPVDGQTTSAVYGELSNSGDEMVNVVGATSSVSDTVELHEVVMNDEGQMSMREKEGGYEIPAGGSITLEPGGLHIMVLDIDPASYPDVVPVTLEFSDGSTLDFEAEVRAVEAMGDMEGMDDMDHGDGAMDDMDMDDMEGEMEMEDGAMEMDEG